MNPPEPDDTSSGSEKDDVDVDAEDIIYTEQRGLPPEKVERK